MTDTYTSNQKQTSIFISVRLNLMVQPHLFYGSYIHSRHRHLNGWYTSPPCERSHKNSLSPFHSEVNNLTTSHRKTVFSKECGSFKKTPRRIKKTLRRFTSNTEAFCPKHRNTSFLMLLVNFNKLRSESVKGAFRSSFHTFIYDFQIVKLWWREWMHLIVFPVR